MATTATDKRYGQRMTALDKANAVRVPRARLRRRVVAARESIAPLLENPPECIYSLPVYELLCWQHRLGRQKARRILLSARISELRPVSGLTPRERKVLAGMLAR